MPHHQIHGDLKSGEVTPEYRAWGNMKQRCLNPKNPEYARYGGRGIKVCSAWVDSFETFLKDIGRRPSSGHSIDRWPDNDGDYVPGNVRWATRSQQQENKRSRHILTFEGVSQNVSAWSRLTGTSWRTIQSRLSHGWSVERTLTEKAEPKSLNPTPKGLTCKERLRIAEEVVRRADTVSLLSPLEVVDIRIRARRGEFDAEFSNLFQPPMPDSQVVIVP